MSVMYLPSSVHDLVGERMQGHALSPQAFSAAEMFMASVLSGCLALWRFWIAFDYFLFLSLDNLFSTGGFLVFKWCLCRRAL